MSHSTTASSSEWRHPVTIPRRSSDTARAYRASHVALTFARDAATREGAGAGSPEPCATPASGERSASVSSVVAHRPRRQRRDGASSFTSAPRHPSLAADAYRLARSKSNDGVRGSCLRWYPRLSASDRVSRLGDAHQRGPICSGAAGQIRNKIRIVSALRGRFVSSVQPSGSSLGARAMRMTTVWRPRVRVHVASDGDAGKEVGVEDVTKKGTKRKRAPPTKGPCEHGVKKRSNCGVCSGCPHGRRRSRCKECGGSGICEHGCVRSSCKECGGGAICEHGRERSKCKECGGSGICEHGRRRSMCKECGGVSICEHGRQRCKCKECGGASICEHGRQRTQCKECGGSQICEHGRRRSICKECGGCMNLRARSSAPYVQGVRWGIEYASTVVSATDARSVAGRESASTVVGAIGARSAVEHSSSS